jgi:glucokinase
MIAVGGPPTCNPLNQGQPDPRGNLAVISAATGGVYVGGIAPKIIDALKGPGIISFAAKGRLRPLLEAIPVNLSTYFT